MTSKAEGTSNTHMWFFFFGFVFLGFFFFFWKECPTSSPCMGVRASLINNTLCWERIYMSVLSPLPNFGEGFSHFLEEGAPPRIGQFLKPWMSPDQGWPERGERTAVWSRQAPPLGGSCLLPCEKAGSVVLDLHKSQKMDFLCEIS